MSLKIKILPIILILCILLTGCSFEINTETYNVTVQGAIFGGNADDSIETEVSFNTEWVTENDNTVYNKNLAKFAAILSADIYFRTKDFDNGTQNRVLFEGENAKEYDWTSFLRNVGFSEVQYIESYKAKEYSQDSNDSVTLLIAHTVVDSKYDLYAVVFRGCFSIQEWLSLYDTGYDGSEYTDFTGIHPEWTDKSALKGLDVAKNRAVEIIDEFMAQTDNPNCTNCMLITGHSRGGALANMIGAEFEDREDIRSYTYTFSAPGVTTDIKAKEYKTIFNIYDENEYFTNPYPFGEEEFYRYGRSVTADIAASDEILSEINRLKGREDFTALDDETFSEFIYLFGQRFPNRASLYNPVKLTKIFDTEKDAESCAEIYQSLISSENGLCLETFCSVECNETGGKYEVALNYCDAAILAAYARSLAYGQSSYEAAVQLFEDDAAACEILDLMINNYTAIKGDHLLINDFVISDFASAE